MPQKYIPLNSCQRLRVVGTNDQCAYAFLGVWPQSSEIRWAVVVA